MQGFVVTAHCGTCHGGGGDLKKHSVAVSVEPGAKHGARYLIRGEGHMIVEADAGDVAVTVQEIKDPKLTRNGQDLHITEWVSLYEALFGFTRSITHPSRKPVLFGFTRSITRPSRKPVYFDRTSQALASHDQDFVIKGKGMPKHSGFGDLVVRSRVKMPGVVSDGDKAKLRSVGFLGAEEHHASEGGGEREEL
ncbi:hypothetical protein T484DRAFT_1818459 [Baffinella frigidus]|nr:hypothetical protein T484DRAFT_1818459 [Cryptophyta sp. CCMP2293]